MKNKDIIALCNRGVLEISTHCLSADEAYGVYRFRKSLRNAIKLIQSEELDLLKEAGIDEPVSFNARLETLSGKSLNVSEAEELSDMKVKAEKYAALRARLFDKETTIYAPKLSYSSWRELQDENRKGDMDVLVGSVEDCLENVLWGAPADN